MIKQTKKWFVMLIILISSADWSFAIEINPYFKKNTVKHPPPPIVQQIKKQMVQGCVSPKPKLRPLGDNYALRHDLKIPVSNRFQRVSSSIVVGDVSFSKAVQWMTPYLRGKNENESIMAYLFLLTHSGRKTAEGLKINNAAILASGKTLANEMPFNLSDFHFHEALQEFSRSNLKRARYYVREAINADPIFYNAHLLLLDIELAEFARSLSRSKKRCMRSIERIFQTTVDLGGLDTCPRHAVLMDEWVRSKYRSRQAQLPIQIISAYVSVLTNQPRRIKHIKQNLLKGDFRQSQKCKGLVFQYIEQLERLQ